MKQKLVVAVVLMGGCIGYAQTLRPTQTLKVALDLVLVPVTVTDSQNRPVTGLRAEDFHVWEDKVEQQLEYVSSDDTPVSLGLVFDTSGSMGAAFAAARSAATTFLKTGNPDDEYFLVEFNEKPKIAQAFTPDVRRLQQEIISGGAQGSTAFLDAVYLALETVKRGTHPRKALLMITDGEDNHSRYSFHDVKEMLKESDVQLYAIDPVSAPNPRSRGLGRQLLQELAESTGGRVVFPESLDDLDQICRQISLELKSQYVLAYVPSNKTPDGKWRKLRVKVASPGSTARLNVRSRTGYYAAQSADN